MKKKYLIRINTIDKVKTLVNITSKYANDFDLVSGRYVIDGKSIMGIFSLDLSKDIDLFVHYENDKDLAKIEADLAVFIVG